MALISVTYDVQESFEAAQSIAGADPEHGQLTGAAPMQNGPTDITRNPAFIGHCMAALGIAAICLGERKLRVLDVGGAVGEHYFIARDSFLGRLDLDWTVLELLNYVEYGRKHVRDPSLRFVTDAREAPPQIDLAYFSGVLQFTPDLGSFISGRLKNAPFAFIARSSLADADVPYVQTATYDDRVRRYAGLIHSRTKLFAAMETQGYRLLTSWDDHFHVAGAPRHGPAMLWKKR